MTEMQKVIQSQKDYLPLKSKRDLLPFIIWIEAPTHRNFRNNNLRVKFNECIKNMSQLCSGVYTLALKKIWDSDDPAYFIGVIDSL